VKPSETNVGGHAISTLKAGRGHSVSYGVDGSTLVLGPSPAAVVAALDTGRKGGGLLPDAKPAQRIKNLPDPLGVGPTRPLTLGMGSLVWVMAESRPGEKVQEPGEEKALRHLLDILKAEEPLVLGLAHRPDQLVAEASYPGLQPLLARVTNYFLEEAYRPRSSQSSSREEALPKERK